MMTATCPSRILFYIPVLLLGLFSCHKDKTTSVHGKVLDKVSGQPIEHALVEISIYHNDIPWPNDVEYQLVTTDTNGEFVFASSSPFSIYSTLKDGYLPKGNGTIVVPIEHEKDNVVTIELIPKDGVLKLSFENNAGIFDTIYVAIHSALQESELELSRGLIVGYPFFVQGTSPESVALDLASNEKIDIYWGPTPMSHLTTQFAPFHDAVFVVPNDTTHFLIAY